MPSELVLEKRNEQPQEHELERKEVARAVAGMAEIRENKPAPVERSGEQGGESQSHPHPRQTARPGTQGQPSRPDEADGRE